MEAWIYKRLAVAPVLVFGSKPYQYGKHDSGQHPKPDDDDEDGPHSQTVCDLRTRVNTQYGKGYTRRRAVNVCGRCVW